MLEYNTMRFGTDVFAIVPPPTVTVRINGKDIPLLCYSSQVTEPALAVRYNDEIYYLSLVDPSNSSASKIRVYIDDTTYAVAKDPTYFDTEDYLVSYLKFDESATKDECGNTWTAVGSPTIGTTGAISGNALQLNGSSYIKRNSTFAFTGQPFTISCHFKSANYSGNGTPCFFQLYVDTNKRFQVNANTQGYCIRLALISGGSLVMYGDSTSYSSKNYFDGNIHHCEMVHENSRWYLFLDGVCVYSGTYSFPTGNYNLAIGYNGSDTNNLLTGQIDEFQIYDGIALHTSDFTPPTPMSSYLVSYLKFDESATKDECGNTWTATGSVSLDTTIKKFGSASLHCQNNGRIVAQNVLDINADKWTFDAWFYSTLDWGTGTHMGFFTFGTVNTVGWNRYGLMQERKKVIIAGSGDSWQITGDFVFNSAVANQWHHLAVVKNGDHVLLFFDGVLVKDHTLTSTIRNGGYFWLGTSMYTAANNESPNVYIDNVRVFDGVALWTSDFTPPTAADYS